MTTGIVLCIIGGTLFVTTMLLLLAADNRVDAAARTLRAADRKLWLARELAIAAGIDPYTIGLPAEDVDDDAPTEPEQPEPVAPTGRHHRTARRRDRWRAWLADARQPFDIADGWDGAIELPRPVAEVEPVSAPPAVDLAALAALDQIEADLDHGLDAALAALVDAQRVPA